MIQFFVWDVHIPTGRRIKSARASWPTPFEEAADAATETARAYAERWRDDLDFPDHPCRDKHGHIVLPASLDMPPAKYIEANAPPEPPAEAPFRLPMSGPMHIVDNASNAMGAKAVYEKSRRGLGKSITVKSAPTPYEAPTPAPSSYTPEFTGAPGPAIAPRFYERDPNHPKYKRP